MAVRAIKPSSLTFTLLPRSVKSKNGHNSVKIAAVLSPVYHLPYAELIASVKHHKTHFTYTEQLKQFMKKWQISKKSFKPLEDYLRKQALQAVKKPEIPISMLNAYLQDGIAPNFCVTFEETLVVDTSHPTMESLTEPHAVR